ncbi:MAG: glycosyltransferase family 87 protein [Promethearchaeia archaeon]
MMNGESNPELREDEGYSFHKYVIYILVGITVVLTILRILVNTLEMPYIIELSRDFDYRILIEGMGNGLVNFYDPISYPQFPPYYLYFWYFMFYPMYLLPVEVGVYIWDMLRLLSCIYVVKEAQVVFQQKFDLVIFYGFVTISYAVSGYFNNVNFLILLLLFCSYTSYERDQKWLAGILFTLATFKINSVIFLPVLLIVKKIKLKDIIYFIVPFGLICIPYILFPDYFMGMVGNWTHGGGDIMKNDSILLSILTLIDSVLWKALQPSHLMFIGFIILIFLENIKEKKWRRRYRVIIFMILIIYIMRLSFVTFIHDLFMGGNFSDI